MGVTSRIQNLDQKNKYETNDGTCRKRPGARTTRCWCVRSASSLGLIWTHRTQLRGEKVIWVIELLNLKCLVRFAKLISLLPALQRELLWTEESGQRFEREGRKHLDKMIAEVKEFLESIFVQEKRKAVC